MGHDESDHMDDKIPPREVWWGCIVSIAWCWTFNEAAHYTDCKQLLLSTAPAMTYQILCRQRSRISVDIRICTVVTGLTCNSLLAGLTHSTIAPLQRVQKCSCPSGAQSWLPWSCDTSASAAALATCGVQNQVQVVCIDAPDPHWTCTTVLGWLYAVSHWIQP